MAGPQYDTSEIRVWLASQLKLEDVPELVWEYLVEERYVKEAQNPEYPGARGKLVAQARKLLKIRRDGTDTPKATKKQRTGKRQKATAHRRLQVEAEIAAKFAQAKAAKDPDVSNGHEEKAENLAPGQQILIEYARALAESPLKGEISNNRITVTAEPWVSPEDVRRKFESLRRIWFYAPTPSARRVELASFVAGFREGDYDEKHDVFSLTSGPGWPGWRGIMEQWNQRYPQGHDWHYTDHRRLRRDFCEVFEALTRYRDF
jgi:hypothetical protein